MRSFHLISTLIVIAACGTPAANHEQTEPPRVLSEEERWDRHVQAVEIFRDEFGVAHVYGKTDADAVFGLMYAQCEDDFPRVERNYIWAIGRLAEVEGREQIFSDLRARMFMTKEEAKTYYAEQSDEMKALCQAWADGINYYLKTHPETEPALLRQFEPWMTMYFTEGSIGGDIERVSIEKIRAFYEPTESEESPATASEMLAQATMEEPAGSNGIAIAGQHTASGNAMLLINPHTTFYFRGEYHMISEEGLNAYGAITWGQFFIYQGFNETTGWMHTSTYTDVIDEFVETTQDRGDDIYYLYGDEWREVEEQGVTLKYLEDGNMKFETFPVYRTHHGPITHELDGKWVATAMMWEPVTALKQSYTRTKTRNYEAFYEMMDMRTNSSNNTVFADGEGNIAYFHGNFIPRRDTTFDYTLPVDGSNPATDWDGLHEVSESIRVHNPPNGWIQNCNSTPFTAAGDFSPRSTVYPGYMARSTENFRGIHARMLLDSLVGDSLSNLTLEGLIALAYDPYLPAFEKVVPALVEAYDKNSGNYLNLSMPIEVMRNWDLTVSEGSVAMTLGHYYLLMLLQNVPTPDSLNRIERFDYFSELVPPEEQLHQFINAVEYVHWDFGRWDIPWGEVSRFQRLDGDLEVRFDDEAESIPVGLASGNWGALAAYGMRGRHDVKRIYGTRGNSFVAVVEFGERVRAMSILAGGQSGDPDSPHFFDQAQRYADAQFKEVAFYREEVMAQAKRRYRPGEPWENE